MTARDGKRPLGASAGCFAAAPGPQAAKSAEYTDPSFFAKDVSLSRFLPKAVYGRFMIERTPQLLRPTNRTGRSIWATTAISCIVCMKSPSPAMPRTGARHHEGVLGGRGPDRFQGAGDGQGPGIRALQLGQDLVPLGVEPLDLLEVRRSLVGGGVAQGLELGDAVGQGRLGVRQHAHGE